jgi:hypothetical protein
VPNGLTGPLPAEGRWAAVRDSASDAHPVHRFEHSCPHLGNARSAIDHDAAKKTATRSRFRRVIGLACAEAAACDKFRPVTKEASSLARKATAALVGSPRRS